MLHRPSLLLVALALACGAESSARPAPRAGERANGTGRPRPALTPPGASGTGRRTASLPQRPLPGPPALPLAEIPEAVPVSVERVGYGGRWLAVCTARTDTDKNGSLSVEVGPTGALTGDALSVELVVGGRKPQSIDDLFAFDPSGRYLAVRRANQPLLLDLATGAELALGSLDWDDRDDALPLRSHRTLAFDPRGELLAYVRRRSGRAEVVLRSLGSGVERAVTDLPGEPYRMAWDGTGEQLVISTLADDTNGNGRLDWPAPPAKGPRFACSGPLPRLRTTPEIGDRPSTFVVARVGGPARFVPDFAAPFGANVVVRAADGELLLAGAGGRTPLTPASCGARILLGDPTRGLLLVACPGKNPQKATVELVGAGSRVELGVEVQPTSIDAWPARPLRLFPLYPGADALLVDLERRSTVRLEAGDQVITTSGARALLRRRGGVVLLDVEKSTTKTLLPKLPPLPFVVVEGSLAVVGSELFDVLRDDPVGSVSGRPLALTPSGEVLVAQGGPPSAERLAVGPLRWERPGEPKALNLEAGVRMVR
ncbi:MAG TPA: hypothetical protein VF103_00025 [Polyangiaceae bacterium]